MLHIIFFVNLGALLFTLINVATLRRPSFEATSSQSVAVLLPMRNEIENVERIINNLLHQRGMENFTIYTINDHSTDGTYEFLNSLRDSRIVVVNAPDLPEGWLGKPHALHSGFEAASMAAHDIFICVDADVELDPNACVRAVNTLGTRDFISPYPRQIAVTMPERLMQPLLQWSWMSSVLVRLAEIFPHSSTAIANGQFFLVKADALQAIDGFSGIRAEVLDDIRLTKLLLRQGFKGCVAEGSTLVSTRMYTSATEIYRGYGKSLFPTFGLTGSIALAIFLLVFDVAPFLGLFTNNAWAIASVCALIASRMVSAISSRNNLLDSLLHPIAILFFISILTYSYFNRNRITWKDRTL